MIICSKRDYCREDYFAPRQTATPWVPLVPSRPPIRPLSLDTVLAVACGAVLTVGLIVAILT